MDLFLFDETYRQKGFNVIAGIDEAGRGPWAGPVVAAAVVFAPGVKVAGLNDSKKLSSKQRELLFPIINQTALSVGVGIVDNNQIDNINILNATHIAMKEALAKLTVKHDLVLVDGLPVAGLGVKQEAIVQGDSKSAAIAAASIIAKVTRDCMMLEISKTYPNYNFQKHKGYGTKDHSDALAKHGPCPIHRKSFAPIRKLIEALAVK